MTAKETTYKKTWALILGGSSGLGLATAHKLALEGFHICVVHRDRKSSLASFEKECDTMRNRGVEVLNFNLDALKTETISTVLESLEDHSISIVVHSIAKGSLKPLRSQDNALSKADLDITIHAMATSWWEWTNACIKANKLFSSASNIAFTSEGNSKIWEGYGAVTAAKAVLEALMRQMAVELAPLGIRTNCIQAGVTRTPSFAMIPNSDNLAEMAMKRNPFNRLTVPSDVANAVALLANPDATWINGTILKVDGGESLR